MKPKIFMGSTMAVALLGVGMLTGSVVGSESASAQTPDATTTAQAATPVPGTGDTAPLRGPGGGMGRHGKGGHGFGGFGAKATADGAAQAIANATDVLATVNEDVAYATGKMDTADVERWLDGADALLKSAQGASSSSQLGQAVAYAGAARELALTAREQIAGELGAANLPSYSQQPRIAGRHLPVGTDVTQAQAGRVLAETYNRLVTQASQVSGASSSAQAQPYLTDAQDAYREAYSAYQAGNYADAVASARLAGRLAHVAEGIARASTAPANADTPVTVPSPNF